ncbi:MAG: hypothetical protein ACK4N5_10575, partial [Myxococcales bacterium]
MSLCWRGIAASFIVLTASAPSPSAAAAARVEGVWDTPLGTIRVDESDEGVRGRLVDVSETCPAFDAGTEVLRGQLLDDVFTGELRVCLPAGSGCGTGEAWLLTLASFPAHGQSATGAITGGCANPA